MRVTGIIFEQIQNVYFYCDKVLFSDLYSVYELASDNLRPVFKNLNNFTANIALDGMWVSSNDRTEFVDLFSKNTLYNHLDIAKCADLYVINNIILAGSISQNPKKFILYKLDTWEKKEAEFSRVFKYSYDTDSIYLRTDGYNKVYCFDYDLAIKWEYDLDGQVYLDFELKPQIYDDLLIINHAYDIVALNKRTGEECWKYTFEDIPTSNVLMRGKIYAVCHAQLYIIDPDDGTVLIQADTGYQPSIPDSIQKNAIGAFPVGDYIYAIAIYEPTGHVIKLFDGECKQLLYQTPITGYSLNKNGSILPTIRDNKIYQSVINTNALSTHGMLMLELIDDDARVDISIQPRPPFTVIAFPELSRPHKLQIFLDVSNLHDALRYGDLLVQELHYATGYITVFDIRRNALDTKHNGEIELIVDDAYFGDDAEIYLKDFSSRITESFESKIKKAGDKKTPIKFTLTRQSKNDWDISGERLDWSVIRDRKTPIS